MSLGKGTRMPKNLQKVVFKKDLNLQLTSPILEPVKVGGTKEEKGADTRL